MKEGVPMRQPNRKPRVRDTVFMSGWLFADLLLALAVLFLAANTFRVKPPSPPPPKLEVTPMSLDPMSPNCTGRISQPKCTVTVGETASSQGNVNWTASSDMSNTVNFIPASGTLSPGKSVTLTISIIPCQNGSFTFSGSGGAIPVTILWHCTAPVERLELTPHRFTLTVHDVNGLLTSSSQDQDIKSQVISQPALQRRSVGLVIAYGGAPTDAGISQAQNIALKIYAILKDLAKESDGVAFQRASYYVSRNGHGGLYTLGNDPSVVEVDVYLFQQ